MYGLIMNKLGNSIRLIVIDLDNTLWGGVVGEDGVNGIKIGETYPGNCFTYFQQVLKSFTRISLFFSVFLIDKNGNESFSFVNSSNVVPEFSNCCIFRPFAINCVMYLSNRVLEEMFGTDNL